MQLLSPFPSGAIYDELKRFSSAKGKVYIHIHTYIHSHTYIVTYIHIHVWSTSLNPNHVNPKLQDFDTTVWFKQEQTQVYKYYVSIMECN